MAFVLVDAPRRAHGSGATPVVEHLNSRSESGDGPVRSRSRTRRVIGHVVLVAVTVFSIFPIYWLFATAFRRPEDSLSASPLPAPFSLENFRYVWNTIPMASMMVNTFTMALVMSVSQLLVAILAAYGFARWNFFGKQALFLLFVGSWLVPFQVTMIPNYLLISQMGLLNTVAGIVIPNLCSAFGVLLMRQHMEAFPRELLDASQIDGQNSWSTLWKVVLPNMKPALAALGIMLFISAWNEYLWPALIMRQSNSVLQIGIRSFLGAEGNNWGAIMAASGLACLPIFLIYLFLQRYVRDAFVQSGLK
ncbi:carbohydrate ABC transporter permease [Rhodococcus sp. KBS0724]|jgi:multiple sugar transport system permease protein/sn-glycerol 3-phosphate transport system permease protein|uniref:carbohydrate ABC transporter permease n=1 Tax=Rhodococcus sp. KBS0724 TaxID=1179674 RepID=UPI00110E1A79|nr:carbohydrate ABC transporter permease [Rhodococcus sp. KBS0724]TSD49844.1 carbohydrate ABC transporter permease [Rhodococcus sp. KBS0724]